MKNLSLTVLLLAAVCLGCKMLSGGGSNGGSPRGGASGGSDPRGDIAEASKKLIALKSFTARMEGMGQTEIKQQVEYLAPDRYRVTYLGGTAAGMELIFIGGQSFMKTGGKWTKMPGDAASTMPTLRDSFTDEGLKAMTDAKFEGEESINGKPRSFIPIKMSRQRVLYPFGAKMWVSKDTGVPMRVVADYTNGVLKQMTVNYDTETTVTIDAPAS